MRTKIFIVILFCAVFLVGGYWAYGRHAQAVVAVVGGTHESLRQGFNTAVWRIHNDKIVPLLKLSPAALEENVDAVVFSEDVKTFFRGMSVQSAQLYGTLQQRFMALPIADVAEPEKLDNKLLLQVLALKKPLHMLTDGAGGKSLVQSLMPLERDGEVQLLLVLTSDVSAEMHLFTGLLVGAILLVFVSLCGLYLYSYFYMRRAEMVIAKQFEENAELVAQTALAKEETLQKSQFLANISHELRTPLNAIIGFSEILKNEFVPAPGQSNHTNYISDIHSAGTHLLSLINDILDYSKAEAGKLELDITEVNAVKTIQNCIRLVQPRAEMAQVRVVDALPKDQAITLTTDGKKFKQVLLNLLSNAVKFTPANGTVKVSAWFNMQDESWTFQVTDTGIGIAPKDISKAMSPFGQVDNALSRKFEGTGLGLPLTKKFVEIMGGKFAIESELNKGTMVNFSLPREFKAPAGVPVKQVG